MCDTVQTTKTNSGSVNDAPNDGKVPHAWYSRLGYILSAFGVGYGAIKIYENNPDQHGHWLVAGVAAVLVYRALLDRVKVKPA